MDAYPDNVRELLEAAGGRYYLVFIELPQGDVFFLMLHKLNISFPSFLFPTLWSQVLLALDVTMLDDAAVSQV